MIALSAGGTAGAGPVPTLSEPETESPDAENGAPYVFA
jgi:hypothetical protein